MLEYMQGEESGVTQRDDRVKYTERDTTQRDE